MQLNHFLFLNLVIFCEKVYSMSLKIFLSAKVSKSGTLLVSGQAQGRAGYQN